MKRPAKQFYTIAEAAKILGVSRQAVHLAIKKGALKAREKKVSKSEWLISAEDLESYRPSNRHQASGKKNN
jgi:excisionase family DNA binding protein